MEIWGAAVIAGWLGSQLMASTGILGANTTLGIITLWFIGALVPVIASYFWIQNNDFEWILLVWALAGVTGILLNYASALGHLTLNPTLIYGRFWFAIAGVGFLATVYYVEGWSRKLYGAAAILNGIVALVFQAPQLQTYYFALAAAIQGGPMIIHGRRGTRL